ncbi:MAG: replicative DNA helicase [Lentisphaeria bacterium]|nr:replicative DNA helicase [Lentisphaeria bacterium]
MPDRSDHAHGAGAAGTGEDSSRNAVPAARSSNSIPQTADYADYEMERSVLACVLADPTCFNTVATRLGVRILPGSQGKDSADRALTGYARNAKIMFRDPKYAAIYQSMLEVNSRTGNPPDLLSVEDDLLRSGRLEMIGGTGALFDIQASIGSVANVETWCGILRQWAMLREMINACTSALQICREPGGKEIHELLDGIEQSFFAVRNDFVRSEIRSIGELVTDAFNHFVALMNKEIEPGIPTGFPQLDNLLGGGLKKQEMVVLAARPSIGKTALALNIARNIAMRNLPDKRITDPDQQPVNKQLKSVAFFSLEMSAEQVAQRLLCTESKVSLSSISDGTFNIEETNRLSRGAEALTNARLFIDPTGGLSVFELRAKARKLKESEAGLDLVIIDYLQLMRAGDVSSRDGRQVEVSAISGGIKKLAKDLDIPVLVLSQLNREVEKTPNNKTARPRLSNLRESGSIEQDADVVIFLHRDRDEAKETGLDNREKNRNGVESLLLVEKNRNGKTGEVHVNFFPSLMEFRSITHKYGNGDIPDSMKEKPKS